MPETFNVTGSLTNNHTVHLDQMMPSVDGPFRIVVEVPAQPETPGTKKESMKEFLERIHADQKARGHVPRTVEEIDASINTERNSWDQA